MKIACPICGHSNSTEIFCAKNQPAMLNRLLESQTQAQAVHAVDLQFRRCDDERNCGFVWNANFDPLSVAYEPGYNNDQSQSPAFRAHLDDVRGRIAFIARQTDGAILEIGCGQGGFLHEVCALTHRQGIGFDPAYVHNAVCDDSTVRIHQSLFDDRTGQRISESIGVIVCRHVLEHLPDPISMLRIAASMLEHGAAMYVEVPCIEWIVRHGAFYDLFNEHCSLFSSRSLERALHEAGFSQVRIARVFGDQYLAAEARMGPPSKPAVECRTMSLDTTDMRHALEESRRSFALEMQSGSIDQPWLVWGAGAKGISLVNHLRLDCSRVAALIDIHPLKRGRFVPLTGQQVIAPSEITHITHGRVPRIAVMNSNYVEEIRLMLIDLCLDVDICAMDGRSCVALHR